MPSRTRRRIRNLTVALLLLGLVAWFVPSYFSAERYRRRLQAGLERALHRPVKFGALSFRLLPRPGFSIENVEVEEDPDFGSEPFARVDHIECDLRWHSLWRSRFDFSHLHLDHPSFNVVLNSRGEWNVSKLLRQSGVMAPPGPAGVGNSSAAHEPLDLDVGEARINFQVGPDKKPFALTDVRARLQVNPDQRRVQFRITASPVRSDLTIPTPGPVELNGAWTPGADLRGPIDARLTTRGALLYDWIPVATGKDPHVYGVMDTDLHISGSLPDLILEGEARLSQLHRWEELPPSDPMPCIIHLRAHWNRDRDRVQVESLDAAFLDSRLHVSGSWDRLTDGPQSDLVISLEHSRLEDVLAVIRRLWPNSAVWSLKGRIDAMLSIQGPWKQWHYGGFVGAQQVSLETSSRSFPLSDIAVHITHHAATMLPVQITLAPRITLSAQGAIDRTDSGPRYELQFAARALPLREAVAFGRGLGIRTFQGIDATGSANALITLAGSAWPLARPLLAARADVRAARLFIPGLTEPLNVPRATLLVNGDQITADPVVAVLGTSIFTARLTHRGTRGNPWSFDVRANSLNLEQGAYWFDALGLRRSLPLLDRLPGLSSSAARREVTTRLFGSLNAQGLFSTPVLTYRGVILKDFQGAFEVANRAIRMRSAKFRADGGRGTAEGTADLTGSPPLLSAKASLTGVSLQSLLVRMPRPARELRGTVNAVGSFQTRGLSRDDLAENLDGQMVIRLRDISFGSADPLASLAQQAHWGVLEPARAPVSAPPSTLTFEVRDRRFILKPVQLDFSGATLYCTGTYAWSGSLNLNVRADLRRLRRRWVSRIDASQPSGFPMEIRLGGPIDHLVVNPQEGMARLGRSRGASTK